MKTDRHITRIRFLLVFFAIALILSGISAILVREGLDLLNPFFSKGSLLDSIWPSMSAWLIFVRQAVDESLDKYPFLAYGLDWLAFGHFMIAIPFLMAARDPRKYSFIITLGIIACVAVVPYAVFFGSLRGIPLYWQGIDTLFGIGGLVVLLIMRRQFNRIENSPG